jgi:ribosomal protein L16 Arg81 hydroxylase
LFDELTFFQPKESIYMVDPSEQKGIHCRFGMKGVIAENHFDGSRNMIVVLGGERRYILSHPDQCEFLSLLPKGHPSARHSAVDWSDPDLDTYPEFALAQANEVVLQAGDVLYLPTNWFHYIISLSLNFQCNTRSGIGQDYMAPIHHCGF